MSRYARTGEARVQRSQQAGSARPAIAGRSGKAFGSVINVISADIFVYYDI